MATVSMTLSDLQVKFQGHGIIQLTLNNSQSVQDRAMAD